MIKRSRKRNVCFIAFLLAVAYTVIIHQNVDVQRRYSSFCKHRFRQKFTNDMNDYRRCLLNFLRPHRNDSIKMVIAATEECWDKKLWTSFDMQGYQNYDEVKFLLLAKPNQSCVEVTLGVGGDIRAEQQLKAAVPQCRFFGADPILSSGRVFQQIGQYFEVAVGANTGVQIQNVNENGYRKKNVTTVDFVQFLNQYVKTNSIDYVWMDNEGAEYGIISKYLIDSPSPVCICQLNAEMHGPLGEYNLTETKFKELFESILIKSQFLPFKASGDRNLRTFFMNVRDTACVDKFILHKFCDIRS